MKNMIIMIHILYYNSIYWYVKCQYIILKQSMTTITIYYITYIIYIISGIISLYLLNNIFFFQIIYSLKQNPMLKLNG